MWEDEGTFDLVSARLSATAANILGRAGDPTEEEVASAIKDGLRKCRSDKQALQIFLGRFQLDGAGVFVYKGTKLHVPAAELWKELVLDVHGVALVIATNMAGVHVSVPGLVQLCIVVSIIGVTTTRLFCVLVFPSVGQDLHNKRKLGTPKDFVERTIRSKCFALMVNLSAK